MKHCITIFSIFLLMFISTLSFGQNVSWNTITNYDNNCAINFPTLPTEVYKNTSEGFKTTTYSEYGQSSYFLKILVFKSAPSNKLAKAKKTFHDLVAKFKGKITQELEWVDSEHKGVKGIFVIPGSGDKPEMTVLCNVIVVGGVQYQIMALTPTEIYDPSFDGSFMNSFRFL
ncbi:MAG: hypothetical protein QNK23_09330 [Crocinitomicaceae bacterium]|nr:hypothetical protein [Crocinitomicaceae bacterium]